jgi:uncharacterized protein YbjQ (UPF0145 family)
MIECRSCNAQNPNGSISCTVCGSELPMSNPVAVLNKPKMAVFHVEEAILDNAAGERIAKRKGLSGKRFEREVASNVEKAVSRAGVRDYVNKLSRDGYTIAFITNMEPTYKSRLQARLRDLGYPVMADTTGPLVLSGGSQDNIRSLANRYDIIFSFGTSGAGTAKQLNVPGVYATVGDYIGNASNPYIAPQATPSPYSLSGLRPEPTLGPYTLANPLNNAPFDISDATDMTDEERMEEMGRYQEQQIAQQTAATVASDTAAWAEAARKKQLEANIPVIRQSIEAWARKYIDPELPRVVVELKQAPHFSSTIKIGMSGAAASELERLKNDSRDAGFSIDDHLTSLYGVNVRVLYTNKFRLGWSVIFDNQPPGYTPPGPPMPMTNPPPKPRRQTSKKTGKKRRESAKKYFDRLMGNKMMNKEFPDNSQRSAVALRYVKEEYGQRGVDSVTKTWSPMTNPTTEGLPIYSGQPTGAKNLGMVSAVVQVGRGFMKDIGEGLQDFYRALIGGRQSMTEKRMMMAVAEMHRDLTTAVKQKGGNAIGNVRLDYEYPAGGGRSLDLTLIATADALKTRGSVKKNPASPKKLKKAKDAYKKFHGGKTPDEITTAKVDVGDVWYSLGECWTIGYMSPKENGNEHQKFIHEMNEESKDGNYPILYATMPEDGEPMLIIKGGSMKIGMRDGKAWLID